MNGGPKAQDAWLQRAANLQASQAARSDISGVALTTALGELWRLIQEAPEALRIAYRDLDDPIVVEAARASRDLLTEGKLAWMAMGDWNADAISIGGQVRAIDEELATRPRFAGPPSSPRSYFCEAADAYVIPRARPKPTGRRPGPGNGFGRRGTPHHRILPRIVNGKYEVELHWSPHLTFGQTSGELRTLGAALFPGLDMKWGEGEKGLVAQEAGCADEANVISTQVEGAFAEQLLAAVWPELTMPLDRLERLQAALAARAQTAAPLEGPTIVAASSWHEQQGESIVNILRVLDKTGRERLRFDKITTFVGGGVREGNTPATTIPVVLNNDALITFAVCSDFCDLDELVPYLFLDVDLILVPSLGNEGAMNGHKGNAERLRINPGASTFVVQQHEQSRIPLGWVVPTDENNPNDAEDRIWSTRQIRFT